MATTKEKNYFAELNSVDVSKWIEQKNNLSYLSWARAWSELKMHYPDAQYTIYESQNGIPYFSDGRTCWVKTGVTVNGIEHIEYLPIMDFRNQSIPAGKVSSTDMNKTIQRSLTKACARHGLGLYIYAGEDLPMTSSKAEPLASDKDEALRDAYETITPEIKTAPTTEILFQLRDKNPALGSYQPFRDALNARYDELTKKIKK